MYSVMLVEDEIVIREGIKRMIAWEEYGFKFVGEAADGELAWPFIQKQKPDIVITDIKMPFMDGLALSRLIKKELPNTIIIILSGYDDFSYAREAINIGVSQYILKPLSKNQLIDVLKEVKLKKDEEVAQERYNNQFQAEVQEYLSLSRRDFFDSLISGKLEVSALLERAEKLNINLIAERYNIILFFLDEELINDNYSSSLAELQEKIQNCFANDQHLIMFQSGPDITTFLVKSDEENIEKYTKDCAEKLQEVCASIEVGVHWLLVEGKPVSRISEIPECYYKARKILFQRDSATNTVVYQDDDKSNESVNKTSKLPSFANFNPNDMDANKMDQKIVRKFLTNGLKEDIDDFVEGYLSGFPKESLSTLFLIYIVLNIKFTVNAFLEQISKDENTTVSLPDDTQELEKGVASPESAKSYICELLSNALAIRDQEVNNHYKEMLKNVLDYMQENYNDPDICLNTVARIANVSATHFSAVFSQQIGKTFVEHITELRMEKARELLCCSNISSSEIALQVGYNDPHYFSFLFKKIHGVSPRDYRNGGRKKE